MSKVVKDSFKNNQAIAADVVGIKKNIVTVLLAELFFIKYMSIVKAPKDTKIIWWLIAIIKVLVKFIYGSTNNRIIIK